MRGLPAIIALALCSGISWGGPPAVKVEYPMICADECSIDDSLKIQLVPVIKCFKPNKVSVSGLAGAGGIRVGISPFENPDVLFRINVVNLKKERIEKELQVPFFLIESAYSGKRRDSTSEAIGYFKKLGKKK